MMKRGFPDVVTRCVLCKFFCTNDERWGEGMEEHTDWRGRVRWANERFLCYHFLLVMYSWVADAFSFHSSPLPFPHLKLIIVTTSHLLFLSMEVVSGKCEYKRVLQVQKRSTWKRRRTQKVLKSGKRLGLPNIIISLQKSQLEKGNHN